MSVKKISDNITPGLNRIRAGLPKAQNQAFRKFVSLTPRLTGNARRRTKFVDNNIISADYPYAQRLDDGYSKQAPQGMTKLTIAYFKQLLKRLIRK